ncbi:MAG: response regulator transcription factor [Chloroflexota bacterium]
MTESEQAQSITVLICDDHQMVREGLRSMLDAPDIDIIGEAESGQQAITKIRELAPDVALMDIRMPGMDGLSALATINESKLSTRIIMVTTYRNTAYLLQALAKGAAGFILKDIPQDELIATVRAVASGTSQVDKAFLESVLRDLNQNQTAQDVALELPESLTPREMDVLRLMVEGLTNQAIAQALILSPSTVKSYVHTIFRKLDVSDRTLAAVKAIRLGLVK